MGAFVEHLYVLSQAWGRRDTAPLSQHPCTARNAAQLHVCCAWLGCVLNFLLAFLQLHCFCELKDMLRWPGPRASCRHGNDQSFQSQLKTAFSFLPFPCEAQMHTLWLFSTDIFSQSPNEMWCWDIQNFQYLSLCYCSWTSFCWKNTDSTACLSLYLCVYLSVSVFPSLSTWLPVTTSLCSSPGQGIWRSWQLWSPNNNLMAKSQSCILSSHTLLSSVDFSDGTGNITSTSLRLWIQMWLTAPERVTSENSKQLSRLFCFEKQAFYANSSIIIFAIFIVSVFFY